MIEIPGTSLLATKLHVPRPRRNLVSRPRLLAGMDEGFTRPLTLLVAPPGFGKTTLIAEWVAYAGIPIAWLSLDANDNDPERFWSYVIGALETLQPGIGQDSVALLGGPAESVTTEEILTALINAVAALADDFSLVLDDYHAIENSSIHSALAFLLGHLPDCMHVIIATRSDPLLPLARLRARGDLVELRAADLRFNADEAGTFLESAMQLSLGADHVAALAARTEGWIAGLQLAGLALRAQSEAEIPDFIAVSTSSNRYLVDYLVEEVLSGQDAAMQDFLCQTALLDRLSAPLCDAVTGRQDSQSVLDYLERTNLFLIPLDPAHEWYRYHTLFGDVLRKLLGQRYPDQLTHLHRRASDWHAQHGMMREAVAHALSIPDYERAADLIEAAALESVAQGAVVTLQGWLKALPAEIVSRRPRLGLHAAAALIVGGDFNGVEPLLCQVEAGLGPDFPPEELQDLEGQIAAMRALMAARAGDTLRVIALTDQALDCLRSSSVYMRGIASWVRGVAQAQAGERAEADHHFAEALAASQLADNGIVASLSLFTFGYLEMTLGRLGQARRLYHRALQVLSERGQTSDPLAALISLSMGELLRLQDDLDGAQAYLESGLQPGRLSAANGEPPVGGLISLAWLRQARGDSPGALAALGLLPQQLGPANRALVQAHKARLHIVQGDYEAADSWARDCMFCATETSTGMELGPAHHFEMVTWAHLLIAQGKPADALAVLERLPYQGPSGARPQNQIDSLTVSALAWEAQGDRDRALSALEQAVALATPEGYVRPLVDQGPSIVALLANGLRSASWRDPSVKAHAERVLAAGMHSQASEAKLSPLRSPAPGVANGRPVLRPPNSSLIEPLSQRELEVLRLAAAGMGNREIAERLVLSVGTVKSHIHSIYAKLGAQDRAEAIGQARELALL